MIIDKDRYEEFLEGKELHIAFSANTEGVIDSEFAKFVVKNYWPELANDGRRELGTVLTKKVDKYVFHALVCYSTEEGWENQREIIMYCFNAIDTDEIILSEPIGTRFIDIMYGANFREIKEGMEKSDKQIYLY